MTVLAVVLTVANLAVMARIRIHGITRRAGAEEPENKRSEMEPYAP